MYSKTKEAIYLAIIITLLPTVSFANKQTEELCLAKTLYHEARGESKLITKLYIAKVLYNRIDSAEFPDTICDVVNEHDKSNYQFSWVKKKTKIDIKDSSWLESKKLANDIINKKIQLPNLKSTILYFNNKRFNRNYKIVLRSDKTIFFEKVC